MLKQKRFFTTGELAEICSVDAATIFRAVVNKTINAATTPGGHFRISREEVEKFLKENNIPFPAAGPDVKRILIVEDNPMELRLFKRALSSDPQLEIKGTESGYEAGFLTQLFKPDLILLDIYLKDIDGRQVAKLIRSDPTLKHTKIVAISGTKSPKDIKDITSAHFDGFIFKPIEVEDLKRRIAKLLE